MEGAKYYVGLDVHKDTIAIAFAEAGSRGEPRFLGTTTHRVSAVTKALSKLGEPTAFCTCHEAGPCGYGLVRELRARGFDCVVIAPSRVARKPADRIKTDRRDALLLARLHRAGELTAIAVPDPVSVGMQKSPLVGIEFSPPIIDREIADGRESDGGRGDERRAG